MGNYKYKFSIIMSIYNVEKYIEEAIQSVIDQTIGFEENIQLILVNDGSPDDSEEICLKYLKKYPNNVQYHKKENGGLSSARNYGLEYREGKYINFLDPDDTLSLNVLEEVYVFFEKHYYEIDFVGIPLWFFEAKTGLHFKYKFLGNKNRVINLKEEPHNLILSSAASFYKNSVFLDRRFNTNLTNGEDIALNLDISLNSHKIGYVFKNVKYNYRRRNDESSIVSSLHNKVETFHSVKYFFKNIIDDNKENKVLKEIFVYYVKILKHFDKEIFSSAEEYCELKEQFQNFIETIGLEFIVNDSYWARTIEEKLIFIDLAMPNNELTISKDCFLTVKNTNLKIKYIPNVLIRIQDVKMINNELHIYATAPKYKDTLIDYRVRDSIGDVYSPIFTEIIDSKYNIKYFGKEIAKTQHMKFSIPIKQSMSFEFIIKTNDKEYNAQKYWFNPATSFALKHNNIGLYCEPYVITFNKSKQIFNINNSKGYFIYKFKSTLRIFKKYRKMFILRLLSFYEKKYILFSERPEKAGDNAEALFKYISTNKEINKRYIYFAISKTSPDYKKIKKIGKVIPKNGLRHKFIYLNSKVLITSHLHPLFYKPFNTRREDVYYRDLLNYKIIWLQHGVTKDDISDQVHRYTRNYEKVVTSTIGERDAFLAPSYFLKSNNITLTGFPRFDLLESKPKNIITIMPTWQKKLTGTVSSDGTHAIKDDFLNTLYYKSYKNLLTNKKMVNLLKKNKLEVNFVLHPGMLLYEDHFLKFASEYVNIISAADVEYSKIFKESKLFITDFSSVFFDFSYLRKPSIYFQFDDRNYNEGYFSYEEDGFGDVLSTFNDVVDKIEYYINRDFKMEKKYLDRIDKTFAYTDKNNSKRVWDEVMKIYERKKD